LTLNGLVVAMTVAAATNWAVFQAFLEQVLIPHLLIHKPGATVVMDNLAAHKIPKARAILAAAGFTLLPLPRYSPDLTPIEPCWAKFKTRMRAIQPRSIHAAERQVLPAIDTVTPADSRACFRHCGYRILN
jgi:hypothetical protein